MYGCGLRSHEVLALTPQQVDAAAGVLRIIGKGNKERVVPLPGSLLLAMRQAWLLHRNRQRVFALPGSAELICRKNLWRAFRAAGVSTGISGFTPHSLRHAFATRLLERQVELRVVQILLGHANIRTTEIYTHLTEPIQQQLRPHLEEMTRGLA
jgi:integrase/recombinase XerD